MQQNRSSRTVERPFRRGLGTLKGNRPRTLTTPPCGFFFDRIPARQPADRASAASPRPAPSILIDLSIRVAIGGDERLKDWGENDFRSKIMKIVRFTPTILRSAPFLASEMN